MNKKLKFNDNVMMNDSVGNHSKTYVKGHLKIKDLEGNILLEQDNLVLLSTRVFLFEHLFKCPPPAGYEYVNSDGERVIATAGTKYGDINHNRKICLFTVGQGGADVNATPFNPYVPMFNNTTLGQPIPFVTYDVTKSQSEEKLTNPSVIDVDVTYEATPRDINVDIDGEKADVYYKAYYECPTNDSNALSNEANIKSYYGKMFTPVTTESSGFKVDDSTGDVSYTMVLTIQPNECRGYMLNEIGLIFGEWSDPVKLSSASGSTRAKYGVPTIKPDYELATRITFDTESLTASNKGLEIEYTMYI